MIWLRNSMFVGLVLLTLSCGGIGGYVYDQKLPSGIGLRATDVWEHLELFDGDGSQGILVPRTIFAIGWDKSHIIAKRHPPSATGELNDKTRTEYFIVDVVSKKSQGPFDKKQFELQRSQLGVAKELDFSLTFPHLE